MSLTELSYEELKQEFIDELKQQPTGALATSDGEDVTNRFMQLFYDELTILCFTFEGSRKFKQLSVNPKVSVATGNLHIDGTATIKGHPFDEENARFIEVFKEQQPEIFKVHETVSLPIQSARVIEIIPKRICRWVRGGNLDILNTSTEKAYRMGYIEAFQVPEYYE